MQHLDPLSVYLHKKWVFITKIRMDLGFMYFSDLLHNLDFNLNKWSDHREE